MHRYPYLLVPTLLAFALMGLAGCADDDTSGSSTPNTEEEEEVPDHRRDENNEY